MLQWLRIALRIIRGQEPRRPVRLVVKPRLHVPDRVRDGRGVPVRVLVAVQPLVQRSLRRPVPQHQVVDVPQPPRELPLGVRVAPQSLPSRSSRLCQASL